MNRYFIFVLFIFGVIYSSNVTAKIEVSSFGIQDISTMVQQAQQPQSTVKSSSVGVMSTTGTSSTGSNVDLSSMALYTSNTGGLVVLGYWYVNSGVTNSDSIVVKSTQFNPFEFSNTTGIAVEALTIYENEPFGMAVDVQEPLFYPSPFSFSQKLKTDEAHVGGRLTYLLQGVNNQTSPLEIHMYDMFGRRVFTKICAKDSPCSSGAGTNPSTINQNDAINTIWINKDTPELNGYELSAGVYFYLFIYEGKVIYKNKVAIVP